MRGLIEQASLARGITRRAIAADEIQRRALLAMVNEAALLLAEGVASRPSDVDVVLVQGYGFPRWEGGPVFWARRQDRERLAADLQQMGREAGHGFVLGNLDVDRAYGPPRHRVAQCILEPRGAQKWSVNP